MKTIEHILVLHDNDKASLVLYHNDVMSGYILRGGDYWLGVQFEHDNISFIEDSMERLINWISEQDYKVSIVETIKI